MLTALSETFLHWQNFFHQIGFLGVLLFAFVLVTLQLFCLPLSPFGIMAGLFFGVTHGLVAIELGTALGAAINFLLARYFARERVARWLSGHEKFQLIDAAIGREGGKIVALLRFCPIPFGLANYSYGLTAVRFVPYMLATVLAIIPGNFFFVWFGATSKDALAFITGGAKAISGDPLFTVPLGDHLVHVHAKTLFSVVGLVAFFVVLSYVAKLARQAVARGTPARPDARTFEPHEQR